MAGKFELFIDAESCFRFRLTAPDGSVMAVSKAFDDKPAAVAGIAAVREYAGMGLVTDLSTAASRAAAPGAQTASGAQNHDVRRAPPAESHVRARPAVVGQRTVRGSAGAA